MSAKIQVLYEFQAEADGELTVRVGETLTVIDAESYDGWLMVSNQFGGQGIVPSSYVEYLPNEMPTVPAYEPLVPISTPYTMPTPSFMNNSNTSYNFDQFQPGSNTSSSQKNNSFNDYDDFDDDDDYEPPKPLQTYTDTSGQADKYSTAQRNSISSNTQGVATIRKPKNLYGLDAFLLVGPIKQVNDSEKLASITLDSQGQAQWVRKSPPYQVTIPNVSSGKKFHGLKEFTTYVLKTNVFDHPVSRRYKQFDWLHERLLDKYPNICIPPLPDKIVTGRFEEEFIKKRQSQLEVWLNRMSAHPIVSQSEIFIYFLQCKDGDTAKWKDFKRKQEKHEYRQAQWLCTVNVPSISSGTTLYVKDRIEKFHKATNNLDTCVKNVMQGVEKLSNTHTNIYRKEFAFMGKKIEELGNCMCSEALSTVNTTSNSKLSEALINTGVTYIDIANMYNEQARNDAYPLLDQLTFYRGLFQQMPELVYFNKNAIQVFEDLQQKQEKEVINMGDIITRLDVVNYATLAEVNYFNGQKINDFSLYMRSFLSKQIEFYSEITEKLQKALAKFEVLPANN